MFLSEVEQGEGLEARWYSCTDTPFSSTAPQAVRILKSWGSMRKEGKGKGNGLEASCGERGLPSIAVSRQLLGTSCSGAATGAPAGRWPSAMLPASAPGWRQPSLGSKQECHLPLPMSGGVVSAWE